MVSAAFVVATLPAIAQPALVTIVAWSLGSWWASPRGCRATAPRTSSPADSTEKPVPATGQYATQLRLKIGVPAATS
jgi:hypothetical protein